MDVVYVVRPGDNNEELRYSLRSLANLPHDRVWLAGHRPRWAVNVGHIPVRQTRAKHDNALANLRAACEHDEVSEEFAYFNDDYFVLTPMQQLPVIHLGPALEVLRTGKWTGAYLKGLRKAISVLGKHGVDDPMCYQGHRPLPMTKTGALSAMRLLGAGATVGDVRTVFGNLAELGGDVASDAKWRDLRKPPGDEQWFVSTDDRSFSHRLVGRWMRARFPEPSPYEKGGR